MIKKDTKKSEERKERGEDRRRGEMKEYKSEGREG